MSLHRKSWLRFCLTFVGAVFFTVPSLGSIGASRDYAKVQEFLAALARDYPKDVTLIEIGQNTQGETIVGVKIGNGSVKNLIVATHHGDEYGSTELALASAEEFAKRPVPDRTIFVVPVLNISGFRTGRREETVVPIGKATVDPNRDYPGPCGTEGPYRLKSTRALADLVAREGIVSSATLHAAGPMVLYPWGISTADTSTLYDREFIELSRMCTIVSGYEIGNSTELLYPADGAFEDYAFWKHGVWSLLFEIGDTKSPTESQLRAIVRDNLPGLRKFMAEGPTARASDYAFRGRCDPSLKAFDLRRE